MLNQLSQVRRAEASEGHIRSESIGRATQFFIGNVRRSR
jgi:hypothetical protein